MSEEITRKQAIGVITMHREHWRRLLQGNVCSKAEGEESIASFDMAIAALESQVADCETCRFKDRSWDEEPCDGCCENHSGYSALSAEPMRWTPVSEGLPEEDAKVLTTIKWKDGSRYVGIDSIVDGEWMLNIPEDGDTTIAWMPLPPSYQGE